MPGTKSLVGSFSVLSHADVIKMAVSMDKSVMESIEPLRKIVIKNLDEIFGSKEW